MHLLWFELQLPATDKFYSGFGNISLQKAHHRGMDTYAMKQNMNCLLVLSLRWRKKDLAIINGKIFSMQTKKKFPVEVFSNNFAYVSSACLNSLVCTVLIDSNAHLTPQ